MRELLQQRRCSLIGSSSANQSPASEPANQDQECASADPALDPPLSPAPRRAPSPTPRPPRDDPHRKARTRLMRRRPTQGVTLSQLREAEHVIGRGGEGRAVEEPIREEQRRDQEEEGAEMPPHSIIGRAGVTLSQLREAEHVIGRGGEGRAVEEPIREEQRRDQEEEGAEPPRGPAPTFDYWQPLEALWGQRQRLRERLQEAELELSQRRLELERVTQRQERIKERPALLELERFERRALERKAAELEEELKALADLRADNERLKDENAALIRVISRLAK
ncbi:protein phosphatase 1 regulatory subunit 12C-like [Pezoporus flaviventris]|uniref:protein phosphatase 1 regulatory subunit 12C-like n=1 Tax=Pezoporus flaviventris TaxID=889875 RepID=UPI002AB24D80|nr:protein phosphatase 1 regulatory subunit 12C-like [Pezoporus flaviventris]